MNHQALNELYVGYRPTPVAYRRFLRWAVPPILWMMCVAAFFWARSQHTPGRGVWEQGAPIMLDGIVIAKPYPMILTGSTSGNSEPVLLVESGKIGVRTEVKKLDGQRVTVSGWMLHRDGRRMLELEPEASALVLKSAEPVKCDEPLSLGTVVLRGEIVDSKCYLGAMKPGEGKTHKECATLCIRGGIPPMLVTYESTGRASFTLLAGPSGEEVEPDLHPFVGDYVEISGDLFERNGLRILRLSAKNVRRL